jgi:chemotaxis signal transduction protein
MIEGREMTAEVARLAMLTIRIGSVWLAIPARAVREVLTLDGITNVPGLADHVLGLALVRGRLVPVVDLPGLLGISRTGKTATSRPRLVVLARDVDEVCVVADETGGVLELPAAAPSGTSELICGELLWNERNVAVLDANAIVDVIAPEAY